MQVLMAVVNASPFPLDVLEQARSVFQAVDGPAYFAAKQVYSSTRMAHPKDLQKAITDARETYIHAGGPSDYDPTPYFGQYMSMCLQVLSLSTCRIDDNLAGEVR
jgi:hypothetical protein